MERVRDASDLVSVKAPSVDDAVPVRDDTSPHFEVHLSANALRPKRLAVFADRVVWGRREVAFDEVDAFAYEVFRHRTALAPAHTGYMIALWVGADRVVIELVSSNFSRRETKHSTELLFESLVSLLHDRVGDRLNRDAIERLDAGDEVRFGALSCDHNGVRYGGLVRTRVLDWDEVAGAEFVNGEVVVHRVHGDGTRSWAAVPMAEPNAVLLVDLLLLAQARFAKRVDAVDRAA